MIVYRYRTLDALHEMKYVTFLGDTTSTASVDDYRAKFSKFDLHGQAIRAVVEGMVGACMNKLVEAMQVTDCVQECELRGLVKVPHEVQLLRIGKAFHDEVAAAEHLRKDMGDILADTEYRAFTTTISLN